MTPGSLSKRIIIERLAWIERMVEEIQNLHLSYMKLVLPALGILS
jgi:hypothetical protein